MTLRRLEKKDISELCKRLRILSDADKKLFHPHPFEKEEFNKLLTLDYDHYFVKIIEGKIIGYSMLRTFGKYPIPTYGQIIWEEYRGKGLGSKILCETLDEAKKLAFKMVKLKVYKHNKVAFNLYRKHNFKEIGTEYNEIWMEKRLTEE